MALIHLTAQEMRQLGGDLIKPGGRQHRAIDDVEAARAVVPLIEKAHEMLVEAQPPSASLLEELTNRIQLVDMRHDDLVRGMDSRLESEYWLTTDEALRKEITSIRIALFATGRAIIQAAYLVEAGEVPFRAARITDDHRLFLRKLRTAEDETLEDMLEELQAVGVEIGVIEKQREELAEDGKLLLKERDARFAWIRAVNALLGVLRAAGVDPEPIIGPIERASAQAERRAAAAKRRKDQGGSDEADEAQEATDDTDALLAPAGSDDPPPDASGPDPDVLDPPIPDDLTGPDDPER